jgi:hypothetical protein
METTETGIESKGIVKERANEEYEKHKKEKTYVYQITHKTQRNIINLDFFSFFWDLVIFLLNDEIGLTLFDSWTKKHVLIKAKSKKKASWIFSTFSSKSLFH